MKQIESIGFESIKKISSVLDKFSARKLFLVTGKQSYHLCGAERILTRLLKGYETFLFSDFGTNPKEADVEKATKLLTQIRPDAIIAVGGGSVIDMAKMTNFFAANYLYPQKSLTNDDASLNKGKPLIAMPTTAGSGSEATQFAVFYIDKNKFSIDNMNILPDAAIIDPQLMLSLPPYLTAATGMDCFGQAIESYWSIRSNDLSKDYAKRAICLAHDNLVNAVNQPDTASRLAMSKAANYAGKAIHLTRTTASHAIAYPLSSYFGVHHGHAVGLTLSAMLEYIAHVQPGDAADTRGYTYVQNSIDEIATMLGQKNAAQAKNVIDRMMKTIGLETRLSRLGINSEADIQMIANNSFHSGRMNNNPRRVTREALEDILRSLL